MILLTLKSHKWPFFIVLFFCFASAIMGDSTAEALLLAYFGSQFVPYLFLINALFLFIISTLMISMVDRTDRGLLFIGFVFVHGCILALTRVAVMADASFLFLPLFSYAYVTKILLFMMFWTLANDLIDSRRAGREFPVIAAGGTLGAILISFSIPWLLKLIAAENLLVIWSGATFLIGLLFIPIRQSFGTAFKPTSDRQKRPVFSPKMMFSDLQLVRSEPLLWNMALLYFLLFFIIPNQHYTFYAELKHHFGAAVNQAAEIAKFLGYFNGVSMFTTFVLQITISGSILKQVGSTRSLFILPVVLALVFLGLTAVTFFAPGHDVYRAAFFPVLFWSVTAGVGTRIAFFDSFFSPNFQIFFSSLPKSIRGRGKLALEGVIKPLAIVMAGIWLGAAVPRLPFHVQMGVLFIASALLILQTFRLKRNYTQSLAHHLRSVTSKNTQWLSCVINNMPRETVFLDLLKEILNKEELGVKEYVIELLTVINSKESKRLLLEHLPSSDPRMRANIVSALAGVRDEELRRVFLDLLTREQDERVIANVLMSLQPYADQEVTSRISTYLSDPRPRIRANAVIAMWSRLQGEERNRLQECIRQMLGSQSNREQASGLYVIGEIRLPDLTDEAEHFYDAHRASILRNRSIWKQFIFCLAKSADHRAASILLRLLDSASKKQKNDLSIALRLLIKRGVPVETFIRGLQHDNFLQRNVVLKAIYNQRFERDKETLKMLQTIAREEVGAVYSDWSAYAVLEESGATGFALLRYAIVEECVNERMQNLFFLASMLDASGEVRRVIHRLHHANKYVRARAFEVLDNSGDFKTNRWIIRLLETDEAAAHAHEALTTLKQRPRHAQDVIEEYRHSPNAWVRQCSVYATNARSSTTAGAEGGAPA
jgi:ATP/ADP translocase/HEAT repeat protein